MYSTMEKIKSSEVRKGNWINDVGSLPFQIDATDIVALSQSEIAGKINLHYNPIPLTPDILEKCGFDYNVDFQLNAKGFSICFEKNGNNLMCFVECVGIDINYLHQLQNLYFALTGSELTFTPNPTP